MLWLSLKRFYHRLGSPKSFFILSRSFIPWFTGLFLILFVYGAFLGLVKAPADYQQGDAFRIMYVHVPAAWLSLFIYSTMTVAALVGFIWRIKTAFMVCICSAPIGFGFTLIALVSGSIWGKPMWGAWWVWDARLTSELILLFIYLGITALYNAFDNTKTAEKITAIFVLIGAINIPIIHYSVIWWNSLHQGPSVFRDEGPAMPWDMLLPLILIACSFKFFYALVLTLRMRNHILINAHQTQWLKALYSGDLK